MSPSRPPTASEQAAAAVQMAVELILALSALAAVIVPIGLVVWWVLTPGD